MAVCHAWMRATQTLDSDGEAPISLVVIAGLTCVGLRDEAISCFGGVEDAKAGLRGWAIHSSDEIGQIVRGLMDAGLIQQTASDPTQAFKGLFTLDGLFLPSD